MPYSERKTIIENLKMVDKVLDFEDMMRVPALKV